MNRQSFYTTFQATYFVNISLQNRNTGVKLLRSTPVLYEVIVISSLQNTLRSGALNARVLTPRKLMRSQLIRRGEQLLARSPLPHLKNSCIETFASAGIIPARNILARASASGLF